MQSFEGHALHPKVFFQWSYPWAELGSEFFVERELQNLLSLISGALLSTSSPDLGYSYLSSKQLKFLVLNVVNVDEVKALPRPHSLILC